jgi:hypothetical protein
MPAVARMETRNCSFDLEDGYILATMFDGAKFELEDAREAVDVTWNVAGQKRLPVLVDSRGVRMQSRAAREYFVSPEVARKVKAVAIVVGSPVSRVIGNFLFRMGKHHVPTELFTEMEAARAWVRTHAG